MSAAVFNGIRRQFPDPTILEPPALLCQFPQDPAETAPE